MHHSPRTADTSLMIRVVGALKQRTCLRAPTSLAVGARRRLRRLLTLDGQACGR